MTIPDLLINVNGHSFNIPGEIGIWVGAAIYLLTGTLVFGRKYFTKWVLGDSYPGRSDIAFYAAGATGASALWPVVLGCKILAKTVGKVLLPVIATKEAREKIKKDVH